MTAGPEEIALAVARLRSGGLVAFPTETVYGLGADALNPAAIARVFALKGRPAVNPLIVHVPDEAAARGLAATWPAAARTLTQAFWPGPLTIVVPKSPKIADSVTAGGPTVALRAPAHHLTLALLEAFGGPLVGPSANPSGRVSPTRAEHVRASFTEDEVQVLDGGPCRGGIESTVITLAEPTPRILRPGLISAEQISAAIRAPVIDAAPPAAPSVGPLPAPGQLPVHYAPAAPAVLVETADLPAALSATGPMALLALSPRPAAAGIHLIPMPTEPAAYASRLYAALREADDLHPALIIIERPPTQGPIWAAITDRLARATARP
jgi:L-threonylcarbamoyladenylate synthase